MWKELLIAGGGTVAVIGGISCTRQPEIVPTPTIAKSAETTHGTILEIPIPKTGEKISILNTDFVRASWEYLLDPHFTNRKTFFELLKSDTFVSEPVPFGAPRVGYASDIGNKVRLYPSLTLDFLSVERINAGDPFSWIAEVTVINPDKSIEVFGLLTKPHNIYEVNQDQPAGTSNIVESGGKKYRIIPAFVTIRRIAPDGCVTWYVYNPSNIDSYRPYSYLPDGSKCYDGGVIGPNNADTQRASTK